MFQPDHIRLVGFTGLPSHGDTSMKTILLALCVGLAAAGVAVAFKPPDKAAVNRPPAEIPARKVDLKLDKKTAIQIAEIVLVKVYGNDVLKQKPWNVTADETSFTIEGTLPKESVGGVARIRVHRANAEIIEIIHGK
ncbi:MAG TPA: NTF2 fold immunity protein [Pirellulales bacterium]|jgi:hypothetical protein|nr:NTF2 fold immunity protein [Pirellulales bacterium]